MNTMEEVVEIVKEKGFLVNNWFQHNDGSWQFNVRTNSTPAMQGGTARYEFGKGSTPVAAARDCLGKLKIQNHNVASYPTKLPKKKGIIIKKKK